MSRKTEEVGEELAALQVPSHSLPHEAVQKASSKLHHSSVKNHNANTSDSKAQRLRDRSKPSVAANGTSGYQAVLNDIERRRGRELRHTLRTAEAARQKQQYRSIALAALFVVALGLAVLVFALRR